jgi:hypothetical protein
VVKISSKSAALDHAVIREHEAHIKLQNLGDEKKA